MKIKIFLILLFLILTSVCSAQWTVDTTKINQTSWNPTNENQEMSYYYDWVDTVKKNQQVFLLRLNQSVTIKIDTQTVVIKLDSVSGNGSGAISCWSIKFNNRLPIKARLPYTWIDSAYYYNPDSIVYYLGNLPCNTRYEYEISSDNFATVYFRDTTITNPYKEQVNIQYGYTSSIRVRSVCPDGTKSSWVIIDSGLSVPGYFNIYTPRNYLLVFPIKMVNQADVTRLQIQIKVMYYDRPVLIYN